MARRAARERRPHLFAGGTLIASGMMYFRLTVLLAIFNRHLLDLLWPSFTVLACLALVAGWLWSRLPDTRTGAVGPEYQAKNPLEFRAAFLFGILFLAMVIVSHYALVYLGKAGLYSLATVMGVVDVDPFILGMTQSTGANTPLAEAAGHPHRRRQQQSRQGYLCLCILRSQDWCSESGSSGRACSAGSDSAGMASAITYCALAPLPLAARAHRRRTLRSSFD